MASRAVAQNGTRPNQGRPNQGRPSPGRTAPSRAGRRSDGAASPRKSAGRKRAARGAAAEPLIELEIVERQPVEVPQTRGARVAGAIKGAGSAVGETIAANAVPAALIGAGLAWLLFDSAPARRRVSAAARRIEESELLGRARETFEEVSERVSGRAESLKENVKESLASGASRVGESLSTGASRVGESLSTGVSRVGESIVGAAESVREGASRLGEYTQEGARTVGAKLRDGASAVGESARRGYEVSREGAARAWQQHPLTTGLAALAAGAAVGMLLPATRRENEALGATSDAVSQRVRTAGRTLVSRGREVAASAAEALKQEAEGEGLGAAEVTRKVRRIADHVREATVTAARRARLNPAEVLAESAEQQPDAADGHGQNGTRPRRKK